MNNSALAISGKSADSVPHLATALQGPLLALESHLLEQQARIEAWLRNHWRQAQPPFYCSVDLRNAGFKIAPVDTNLFPAGFNNLDPAMASLSVQAIQTAILRDCPDAIGILIIPENHTRNQFYLESVATLAELIAKAGYEVRIGSLNGQITEAIDLNLPSGRHIRLEPLQRKGKRVHIHGFSPCAVLLNNDLLGGRPPILEDLEQTLLPPLDLGWADRLKSEHFAFYHKVAREFAALVDIDPWLVDPLFRNCGEVDFKSRESEDCLVRNVDQLLADIRAKYREHDISDEPFVVVKADAGTYGMGIMTAFSGDDLKDLNRKQRNKMSSMKGGARIDNVIIQEGVYTFETLGTEQSVAEPVVYMIDQFVVGGFYRVHTQRSPTENLNAPGMHFQPLAFHQACNTPEPNRSPDCEPNRFYVYGVIARLAALAAAREIAALA